jgi:hypothetical protein
MIAQSSVGRILAVLTMLLGPLLSSRSAALVVPAAGTGGPARTVVSPSRSIARYGPQPFVILFCQFPDTKSDEDMPKYYRALMGEEAPGLRDYWREVSYGQIDLAGSRVEGWYLMPHSSGDYKLRPADWIPAARKYVAAPGSRAQITLEQLAQPQADNFLMAVIALPGEGGRYYTVEARRRVGYDRNLPMDAVVIHLVDPESRPTAIVMSHEPVEGVLVDSAWVPGMVFRDARNGVEVAVDAATETGFVVTITVSPA